ncbi:MAG: hypothetical protein IPL32_20075 [Chloracidobacterium sp.]|nr:hypothetical protein [Chloracidobacterium sp.]
MSNQNKGDEAKLAWKTWMNHVEPEVYAKAGEQDIFVAGFDAGQRAKALEIAKLKIALADAIRCPMGVCPDSAVGLFNGRGVTRRGK